jgi:hypothetical protein
MLKATIMCHVDMQRTETLPKVLLSIHTAYKDLQSSTAELVYGKPLRVPSELLIPATPKVEASLFIQQLRHHMDQLRPSPAALRSSLAIFVHKDLRDSTHIFLRLDTICPALEPPYSSSHLQNT